MSVKDKVVIITGASIRNIQARNSKKLAREET
jgi:hypothetical protein